MLYLLTSSFIAGIFLGTLLPLTLTNPVLFFVFCGLLTTVSLIRESRITKLSMCVLLLFVGVWRYQLMLPKDESGWIQSLNDVAEVTFTGQVMTDPERGEGTQKMEVGRLRREGGTALRGMALIKTRRLPEYSYGDEIEVTGNLKTPSEFEDFSYRQYLATQGVYSLVDYPKIRSYHLETVTASTLY